MARSAKSGTSFYLFDFDDNIMFLSTTIFVQNTETKEEVALSTGDFALVHPQLGRPGNWENFAIFDGSYRNFRDLPPEETKAGRKQHFVADVEQAIGAEGTAWQGPAWEVFVYACRNQRPVSIVTARGHSARTLKAGVRVLLDRGLIPQEPNFVSIYPVSNDTVRRKLGDRKLELTTPALKKRAIVRIVEDAVREYGVDAELRFGMSDDDPANVALIIRAMSEAKLKYRDKRFFVINTHFDQKVKLEVFPVDFSVTGSTLLSAEPAK